MYGRPSFPKPPGVATPDQLGLLLDAIREWVVATREKLDLWDDSFEWDQHLIEFSPDSVVPDDALKSLIHSSTSILRCHWWSKVEGFRNRRASFTPDQISDFYTNLLRQIDVLKKAVTGTGGSNVQADR